MKIIQQTPDQIITQDSGGSYVMGAFFLLIGIAGIYAYYSLHEASIGGLIVPGVFGLIAIFMILKKTTTIVDINKSTGKISFSQKSLLSNTSTDYDISNAQSIELREGTQMVSNNMNQMNQPQGFSFGNNYNNNTVATHQTVLMMKDGTELPLESVKSSGSGFSMNGIPAGILMGGRGKMFALSNQLAQFIGVPFNDVNGNGAPVNTI